MQTRRKVFRSLDNFRVIRLRAASGYGPALPNLWPSLPIARPARSE